MDAESFKANISAKQEQRRAEAEAELAELLVHEKRLELSRHSLLSRMNISVPTATIFVGCIGFIGSVYGSYLQTGSQIEAKKREFESNIIIESIKSGDFQENLERLRFMIDAGYLSDDEGRISSMILSGKYGTDITLPSPSNILSHIGNNHVGGIFESIITLSDKIVLDKDVILEGRAEFTPIAAAVYENATYKIIYDKESLDGANENLRNNWNVAFVLAHEVAHIALGHLTPSLKPCFSEGRTATRKDRRCTDLKERELEADYFAGCTLRLLGANLAEASHAFDFLPDSQVSYYPTKSERGKVASKGWAEAQGTSCS